MFASATERLTRRFSDQQIVSAERTFVVLYFFLMYVRVRASVEACLG